MLFAIGRQELNLGAGLFWLIAVAVQVVPLSWRCEAVEAMRSAPPWGLHTKLGSRRQSVRTRLRKSGAGHLHLEVAFDVWAASVLVFWQP